MFLKRLLKNFDSKQVAIAILTTAVGVQGTAFAKGYEAWYDASTDSSKSTPIPSTVHTYYDGKMFYSKSKTALGDTIGYYVEISCDPSTVEFVTKFAAKSLGKKSVKGKECQGYRYFDPIEKRDTESWFDSEGKLFYQKVESTEDGAFVKYEQSRTSFKIDPESSTLTTDPDITSNNSGTISLPGTVPYNADESPYVDVGKEKTNLKPASANP